MCPNPEGRPKCDWVIVDAGSVVIHLFRSEIRELYNLEIDSHEKQNLIDTGEKIEKILWEKLSELINRRD